MHGIAAAIRTYRKGFETISDELLADAVGGFSSNSTRRTEKGTITMETITNEELTKVVGGNCTAPQPAQKPASKPTTSPATCEAKFNQLITALRSLLAQFGGATTTPKPAPAHKPATTTHKPAGTASTCQCSSASNMA